MLPDFFPKPTDLTGNERSAFITGVVACWQSDYSTAIRALSTLVQSPTGIGELVEPVEQKLIAYAQVGLVVAYSETGQTATAIAHCQSLTQSSIAPIHTWAIATLASLHTQLPPCQSDAARFDNASGFVPLDPVIQPNKQPKAARFTSKPLPKPNAAQADPASQRTDHANDPSTIGVGLPTLLNPATYLWRQAPRAQRWQPQPPPSNLTSWVGQISMVMALSLLSYGFILLSPFPKIGIPALPLTIGVLLLCWFACPWLIDGILQSQYGLEPLSSDRLHSHSPEALRLLRRSAGQFHLPLPTLHLLPLDLPIAFSYGNLPRTARIVVSRGLLNQLADDEIATVYAAEWAHIIQRDCILLSWATLLVQIPYLIYWQFAVWSNTLRTRLDTQRRRSRSGLGLTFQQGISIFYLLVSVISYGIYRILRWPLLWPARSRLYNSDRHAVAQTGNPNGLTRALLKIAMGWAVDLQKQRQLHPLLDSFDSLLPLAPRSAVTIASFAHQTDWATLLQWDYANPYRHWFSLNSSHPPLGDRLHRLHRCAQTWKLEPELDLSHYQPAITFNPLLAYRHMTLTDLAHHWRILLSQGGAYTGLLGGVALGLIVWQVGAIAGLIGFWPIAWIFGDRNLFVACLNLGIAIGIIVRINSFFPDAAPHTLKTNTDVPSLLTNPSHLPNPGQPIHLQGRLLGRPGTGNWLTQDLWLHTESGLIRLHWCPPLSPLSHLLARPLPLDWLQRSLHVSGWFHRGVIPWIDINTLRSQSGTMLQSQHPICSLIIATLFLLVGMYLVLWGTL